MFHIKYMKEYSNSCLGNETDCVWNAPFIIENSNLIPYFEIHSNVVVLKLEGEMSESSRKTVFQCINKSSIPQFNKFHISEKKDVNININKFCFLRLSSDLHEELFTLILHNCVPFVWYFSYSNFVFMEWNEIQVK